MTNKVCRRYTFCKEEYGAVCECYMAHHPHQVEEAESIAPKKPAVFLSDYGREIPSPWIKEKK